MIENKRFLFSLIVCIAMLSVQARANSDTRIAAIMHPSANVTLSFVQSGRIVNILVKEGELINASQVLVQQDDAVDRAQLAQLKADSKNMTNIEAGKVSLAQKHVDLQKLETTAALNATTELEAEHAKLYVKIAELSLELAIFEHEQAVRKYEEAKLQIDSMSLKSPINGSIEKIEVKTGESVNALESVFRVIQIDPLWIDVPVPLSIASSLARDVLAKVHFPGPDKISVNGKIVFIAAIADAGSGTLRVRVEVSNKAKRPAGEHVTIFSPSLQAKKESIKK